MAKDPAFLFYPNDFDCKTKFFTDEQVGVYLRLLIAQFQFGRLSKKQVNIICKSYDEDIMLKFDVDEKGFYYNERLESEIHKRKKYSDSRKNNRNSKNKNISESYDNHMTPHMENENVNVNENENKIILNGKKFLNSDFQDLPEHFYKSIIEQMFILKQKRIDEDTIFKLWDAFKLEKLTGVVHYNSEDEVYKHFSNWIKSQKFIEGEKTNSEKRKDLMYEYLNRPRNYFNEP
tara:strand:- start:530 stop:1228 length:699 start_codon:yes stop_codon:yes gene_type:complete